MEAYIFTTHFLVIAFLPHRFAANSSSLWNEYRWKDGHNVYCNFVRNKNMYTKHRCERTLMPISLATTTTTDTDVDDDSIISRNISLLMMGVPIFHSPLHKDNAARICRFHSLCLPERC